MPYTMDLFRQHGLSRKQFLLPVPEVSLNGYECLSSYIQRIANNHYVSTVHLIEAWNEGGANSMFSTFVSYAYGGGMQSYRINGRTDLTSWLAELLVKQDLLIKVNQMAIPKDDSYQAIELRKHLAWCPKCLQQQSKDDIAIHYPLLWMPKNYTHCHQHKIPLIDQCPKCFSYQPVMAFHNHPGKCANCFTFLGESENQYPYGFQEELWRRELNQAITKYVRSKRYSKCMK